MSMRTAFTGLITLALAIALAATVAFAAEKKQAPPSFKPGAEITLALTISAPAEHALNEMLPLTVSFTGEKLKDAPYSVDEASYEFELKGKMARATVAIPVTLKDTASEGSLRIPVEIDCIICTADGESCLPVRESVTVTIPVRSDAPAGEKNQALTSGELPVRYTLSAPAF